MFFCSFSFVQKCPVGYFCKLIQGAIPDFENFVKIEPISEGLSKDKKFYVESAEKKQLLLRTERPAYPEYIRGVFACDGDNLRMKSRR